MTRWCSAGDGGAGFPATCSPAMDDVTADRGSVRDTPDVAAAADASAPSGRTDTPDCPARYPLATRSTRSRLYPERRPSRRCRRAKDPYDAPVVPRPRWNLYPSLSNLDREEDDRAS